MSENKAIITQSINYGIPKHVSIICDGNGRWAKQRGLPRSFGHKAGVKPIKDITEECAGAGVKILTLYVFSTENWKRDEKEVGFLMNIFVDFFGNGEKNFAIKEFGFIILG